MTSPLRVLLVEDSEDDAILVLRTLRQGGFEVLADRVDTPDGLRQALARQPWDLIIADYVIPGFGALAALKLLKESGLDVPVIVVSGQMGEETAVGAMKAGAHDYLLKDKLARLAPAINRELAEAEERRARRQVREALRESELRFRELAENLDVAFIMGEAPGAAGLGRIAYVSTAYAAIWGRPLTALYENPQDWLAAVHPDHRSRVEAGLPGLARGEFCEQFQIVRPDGSVCWVHFRAFPVHNENGELYRIAALAEDITASKVAEAKLAANAIELQQMVEVLREVEEELRRNNAALREARAELEQRVQERTADLLAANNELQRQIQERRRLEAELLDITEKERRRIGIDLHDDLGQHLNGIALLVEALQLKLRQRNLPEVADVERIRTLLFKTINHAHDVAHDLAAVDFQGDDLAAALRGLAQQAESLFVVNCRMRAEGTPPALPRNTVNQLYKIAQEAVTNAIKHGRAKQVQILLACAPQQITLTVRNDGEPFPETIDVNNRMGLRIMRYRANVLGAKLDIKGNNRRGGTVVTCALPLTASPAPSPAPEASSPKLFTPSAPPVVSRAGT